MNTRKLVEAVIVAAMSAALAAPVLSAEGNLIDLKKVESQIVAAQNQVVGGNLDAGLKALQGTRTQAVTADLAARVEFVGKLAEVRMAEKIGDQAKVMAALNEAFKQAKQPDQVQATWAVGLAVAQATVAAKGNAAPVIDFLAKGPSPAVKQFGANVELAKLRIATGNVGAAEAELRNAAQRANSAQEWSAWVGAVTQLATTVDGGQSPQAGADVFERLRDAVAGPARSMLDVAEARLLIARDRPADVLVVVERAAKADVDGQYRPALVGLCYTLALAYQKGQNVHDSERLAARAEELAATMPATAAMIETQSNGLKALGRLQESIEILQRGVSAVADEGQKHKLLLALCDATAAAGRGTELAAGLSAIKAGPDVYVALASGIVRGGNVPQALRVLAMVSPESIAGDARATDGAIALMKQVQGHLRLMADEQTARAETLAQALDRAANQAGKAGQAERAAALTQKATAIRALAGQAVKK